MVKDGPNPILPSSLTNLFMMDKGWAEAQDVVDVQDYEGGDMNHAGRRRAGQLERDGVFHPRT